MWKGIFKPEEQKIGDNTKKAIQLFSDETSQDR